MVIDTDNLRLWATDFDEEGEPGLAKLLRDTADELDSIYENGYEGRNYTPIDT